MSKVSIILVAYHSDPWLPKCLEGLPQASKEKQHLILVDNSGNTNLRASDLSSFDVTEILKTPKPLGFAEANNFALANTNQLNDCILFLNQDTVSPALWIDRCLKVLNQNPQIGALSPLIRNYDDTAWDPSFLDCLDQAQKNILTEPETSYPDIIYTDHAPAPALIVRKSVLDQTGPFDPIYGSYYEDYDLCARIRKAGYKIGFCTAARIQHFSGSATNSKERVLKRMRQIIRNRGIYGIRYESGTRLGKTLKLFGGDFPRRLVRSFLGTPSSQPAIIVLLAYVDLLKELPRLLSEPEDKKQFQQYFQSIGWKQTSFY